MSPDSHTSSAGGSRCPSCGARAAATAAWCSLCFTDITSASITSASRAAEVPAPRPAPSPSAGADPASHAPVDVEVVEELVDVEGEVEVEGEAGGVARPDVDLLLAELAAGERTPRRWAGPGWLTSTPGARVGLMLAGTVLLTAVGFGLLAALGSLL